MQALRAGGLDERGHAQGFERVPDDPAALEHLLPFGAGARIEVEVHVVGPIDVIALRIPLVQIDASEVDHPQQRWDVVDDGKIDDRARVVIDAARADPVRTRRRRAFHEEELAAGPVRVPLHDHGPVADVRQQEWGDVRVGPESDRPW